MNKPLLDVKDLKIQLPGRNGMKTIVDGLNFTILSGATLGIVGESGSGKTMTALSLMGFIPYVHAQGVVSGKAEFTSQEGTTYDLFSLKNNAWSKVRGKEIGMIFQEPMSALNPVLKCGFQVAEALDSRLSKSAKQTTVLQWFEKVQLKEPERIYHSFPHQLSGGQQQRVMIAMALAGEPRLLLADEPTTALDVTTQKEILKLLKDLQADLGLSILFISHDLGVIAELADQVLVLQAGVCQEYGPIKEVFKNPQAPYTKGLIACRPPLDHRPHRLPTLGDFLGEKGNPEKITETKRSTAFDTTYLSIQQLSVSYPGRRQIFRRSKKVEAVKHVSFEIKKGESLGLVGESGSGKTTLGKAIVKLLPAEGKVLFEDKDLVTLKPKDWKPLQSNFQMIFQDPYASLNPRMSIGEALIEPMTVHGLHENRKTRWEKAAELLELVKMEASHLNRLPKAFSGGQRQRICIARALALQPEFLVCDECVSALDVSIQAEILNLLADLRDQFQLTLLFISHDLSVVRFFCDRIAVMQKGRIVEMGEGAQILDHPKEAYTQALIAAIPKGI